MFPFLQFWNIMAAKPMQNATLVYYQQRSYTKILKSSWMMSINTFINTILETFYYVYNLNISI